MSLSPGVVTFLLCLHACVFVSGAVPSITSVPRVRAWVPTNTTCPLGPSPLTIAIDDESLRAHADVLALELMSIAGLAANVSEFVAPLSKFQSFPPDSFTIFLSLNKSIVDSQNHFYEYHVSIACSQIVVTGGSTYGVAHGTATILQQLRSSAPGQASISSGSVSDFSTVEWTGFMYDLSRDPVDTITFKSLIDLARFYKMRFFHVFATAESGWRLPIAQEDVLNVPLVFKGLVYYYKWDDWWLPNLDHGNLGLQLHHAGNGVWQITSPHGAKLGSGDAVPQVSVFYFNQQGFKPTDVPNITFSQNDTTITVNTFVNGNPTNLWWTVWIDFPTSPLVPVALDIISSEAAAGGAGSWCNNTMTWVELNTYAEARGVTLLPGIEVVGHNVLFGTLADVFGDPSPDLTCTNLASDTAIAGVKMLLDSTVATFPFSPIIHIGMDEVSTSYVAHTTTAAAFCQRHGIVCDEAHIVDYFLTTIDNYILSKPGNLRVMGYENVNTPGTLKAGPLMTMPWWINGGNGYMEDQIKADVHGDTLSYATQGLDTVQTPWKPRVYTRAQGLFEHSVAGTLYPHPGSHSACTISPNVKYNNTDYADGDGPRTATGPEDCCSICSATANCRAWSFQIDPQFPNVTECRWAHLTYCCWLHADSNNPISTDPTFTASGAIQDSQNPKAFPIPVNEHLLGQEVVLWETQRGPQDKVGFLRMKAPLLAENTYAFGADTTSWFNTFVPAFAALDNQFSTLMSGFRLVELGLTEDLSTILRTNTETSMDPIFTFSSTLNVSVLKNRQDIVVRYTVATYELDSTGSKITYDGIFPNVSSTIFPGTLVFTPSSPELGSTGYVVLRLQAYDETGTRVGEPLVRRYWCQPFTLVVAGTLRGADLSGLGTGVSFGPHVDVVALFTEGFASIRLESRESNGVVRYSVGSAVSASSPELPLGQQLDIASSTDTISIAFFSGSQRMGRVWASHFNSNLDQGIFGGQGSLKPLNAITLNPSPGPVRFQLPLFATPGNTTALLSSLIVKAGFPPVNTSVKLTVVVVGGGGAGGLSSGALGGGGGGAGGVATEVYFDLLTCYPVTIEVGGPGEQSSVAFADQYSSGGAGRGTYQAEGQADTQSYPVRSTQDPIWPTVSYPGASGVGPLRGNNGGISKGDATYSTPASNGGAGVKGRGAGGWVGAGGLGKGAGAGGASDAAGTGGAVLLVVELLSSPTPLKAV